jgi:RNA polymerase sigma-70 factor, ECF subfamily
VHSPDLSDEALLNRLLAGDDSALARIYECYGPLVYGLARRVTASEATASEIAQDVFAFLWQHPDRVDLTRGSLRAYLGMITHRRAVDAVRSATRRTALEQRASVATDEIQPAAEGDYVAASTSTWQAGQLRSMIETLPAEQRDALTLAYFDGCTYRQVATKLGIPEGTAKSRLRLALARLRSLIETQPMEAWR